MKKKQYPPSIPNQKLQEALDAEDAIRKRILKEMYEHYKDVADEKKRWAIAAKKFMEDTLKR